MDMQFDDAWNMDVHNVFSYYRMCSLTIECVLLL
jgi:hypothetical protein